MDIEFYDIVLKDLQQYNDNLDKNYGNVVLSYPSTNPTYPYTIFDEIRNNANQDYNTRYDKVASVGYTVNIYAKTKGNVTKKTIARKLMKDIDDFLTNTVGLFQMSMNDNGNGLENDSSIYHIVLTYTGNLHENRRQIM